MCCLGIDSLTQIHLDTLYPREALILYASCACVWVCLSFFRSRSSCRWEFVAAFTSRCGPPETKRSIKLFNPESGFATKNVTIIAPSFQSARDDVPDRPSKRLIYLTAKKWVYRQVVLSGKSKTRRKSLDRGSLDRLQNFSIAIKC